MIFGALMLGAELLGVDAAFYLVFLGVAALVTGFVSLSGAGLEPWAEWLIFSALALIAMVVFRQRFYEKFRGVARDYPEGPSADFITLESTLQPGETGRQQFHGSEWTVHNQGDTTLEKGNRVKIMRAESLTLIVGE
jgi:membrane protein implicated in regulation of membrane protease activity